MKTILATLCLCLFASSALANDGGMAYIDVQGVNPKEKAQDGTTIEFYGKDAANFMRLLPNYSSIEYSMLPENVSKLLQDNERGVALISNGWTLMFNCRAGKIEYNGDYSDPNNGQFVSQEPSCTISLNKNQDPEWKYDQLGDAFEMEPKNYSNMCQQ
jgi:hypothetical protein